MAAKIAAATADQWLDFHRSGRSQERRRSRGRGQVVSLTGDVALLGRPLDVGGGLDHGDVQVLAVAAAVAVHLGDPHGGRVLDGAARLPPPLLHRHRAHRRRRRRRRLRARTGVCLALLSTTTELRNGAPSRGSRVADSPF